MDEIRKGAEDSIVRLPELCWEDISEPGAYLLIAPGLLARIFPDELPGKGSRWTGARVVKLSKNPGDSLTALRLRAARFHYPVNF